ncbi:UDP-2,3-diacylglucosamine hydrolase [Legionella beliardensis]|uniref:UDP-2,3-diacylglucosamine hydrolase n=1 Tax=Legionella beliardensis TaxID=91822 RepID=A0A378I378_9GAMM|nr:UDP-2,3-diacylglucosamine diphosphatase [Legionella beliardensis]STX29136.1 UDP-2,3-diacylglucosamine hydrolase [Legionella beliardensis]
MLDAVFISDLHLHPQAEEITKRFEGFTKWAATNTRSIYILGDFFHAWAGDDTIEAWSLTIANQLKSLVSQGIKIFFMHGNRDFLVGREFSRMAHITLLPEPSVIKLADTPILLVHGDRYCTQDKAHQRFRRLTRNALFTWLFLHIPKTIRQKMVARVRQHSQNNRAKPINQMAIESSAMLNHMQRYQVKLLIHGHTHKPGLTKHYFKGNLFNQYVLSDWDDNPQLLCYHKTKGFYFTHIYL